MILIERALRDEGTSYHYMLPSPFSYLHPALREMVCTHWDSTLVPLHVGTSWTTDAPFRETEEAIAACRELGILAVEMEAAALYALASARQKSIICFAHVTNSMGQTEGDFEKGQEQGSTTNLEVLSQTARVWQTSRSPLEEKVELPD
jgi:purine-nucleoside phosphorylase